MGCNLADTDTYTSYRRPADCGWVGCTAVKLVYELQLEPGSSVFKRPQASSASSDPAPSLLSVISVPQHCLSITVN